ncbi:SDR family oxidoreductase [Mucilaginibacter auburnensis]|uniref:Short-subunit dehydrogenase n=1 Tax=Mucilaginibacter auburnensis TaxID=1457233 RepID=A0A2H9VQB3_9SPHI|nr:SDR family oxidoreductase [Mucilaginibacter auburnensis]PJJ80502.1 short-subunit dehydrogenase [Mucilaginibacter auburnensis]
MSKVILVTGASSGIGLASATALHNAGHTVYGTTRNIDKVKNALPFKLIQLDVTSDESAESAVAEVIKAEGKIDMLVNNAGNGIAGPAYAMPVDKAKQQFEVNFFGVVRMCSKVIPEMLKRNSGTVVNISSLGGLFGLPYQSMYSASKYAIEGYSESMRMELLKTGVKVVTINPGDFKSDFSSNREKILFTVDNAQLNMQYNAAVAGMEKDEAAGANPQAIGKQLVKIAATSSPKHQYLVGAIGQTIAVTLKKMLPGGLFEKLMADHYGIK